MRRLIANAAIVLLGSAVIFGLTGCSLTGWNGVAGPFINKPAGGERVITSYSLGYLFTANTVTSYTHYANFNGGSPALNATDAIYSLRHTLYYYWEGGGFDPAYNFIAIAERAQSTGVRVQGDAFEGPDGLTHWTTDTSGDGYISGPTVTQIVGGACGITQGYGLLDGSTPVGAYFQDEVTCYFNAGPNFYKGLTESAGSGGGLVIIAEDKNGYNNGALRQLPFATRVQLLNSVSTDDVLADQKGDEWITVRLTGMELFGQAYEPKGVNVKMHVETGRVLIDPTTPGYKAVYAWMADQVESAVNQGRTQLEGSMTFNGSVTLSTDLLAEVGMVGTGINEDVVEGYRAIAAR